MIKNVTTRCHCWLLYVEREKNCKELRKKTQMTLKNMTLRMKDRRETNGWFEWQMSPSPQREWAAHFHIRQWLNNILAEWMYFLIFLCIETMIVCVCDSLYAPWWAHARLQELRDTSAPVCPSRCWGMMGNCRTGTSCAAGNRHWAGRARSERPGLL